MPEVGFNESEFALVIVASDVALIDVSELPTGEYLIRISFEGGVEVKKFIVNR